MCSDRGLHTNVHRNLIHSSQNLETTQKSSNGKMVKTLDCSSATNRNELLVGAATRASLQGIRWCEESRLRKAALCVSVTLVK